MSFHDDCLVFDGHTDVPTRLWESPADLSEPLADRHIDLPRLRAGGVDALVFALYVPSSLPPDQGWEHALALYRLSEAQLAAGKGLVKAVYAEDVRRAVARGEVAVVYGLENGRSLILPKVLDDCAKMGIRYITLTHVGTHEWCDASTDAAAHSGLSDEGIRLVREMNRRGILPDVSHVSDVAVERVLEVSLAPPIASHSSARALCDVPRNLPDPLIREIARVGGLVMANTYPAFVGPDAARANRERMAELRPVLEEMDEEYLRDPAKVAPEIHRLFADHPLPKVPLDTFVDHVIHLIELGGEEHVGIGTDFDGISETLEGFEDPSRFPALTAALLERGVDRSGVRLILGENFLRALELAEQVAR
ncbi:MAG: rane dipeptidase [Acidobacteriota bacterium]|jgi:membrane dipeptidase|nr:rane dipeptidase [Acidobacteriota bacterium]